MRHESFGLETYSPYQDKDLMDTKVFDSGDLELCFGSSEMALQDIEVRATEILQDGKLPLLLGGEHLVTLGAVRAVAAKYPELEIIHFDAHADLRPVCFAAAMTSSAMAASTSSASGAASGRSSASQRSIPICTGLISPDFRSSSKSFGKRERRST